MLHSDGFSSATIADDEIEQIAEAIHNGTPVMVEGHALDWADVIVAHPEKAATYRSAARNRIRASEAMRRLAEQPTRAQTASGEAG